MDFHYREAYAREKSLSICCVSLVMPHRGNPETIKTRRAQILEGQSTLTPTTAAALGRNPRIKEKCAALK
jgi:hypothetical protein